MRVTEAFSCSSVMVVSSTTSWMSCSSTATSAVLRMMSGMRAMSTPALKARLTASVSPKWSAMACMFRASVTLTPLKPISVRRMSVMNTWESVAGR